MNTVPAGRGSRMSVPLPASSRIGRPFGGICVAALCWSPVSPGGGAGATGSGPAATAVPVGGDTNCAELLALARMKLDCAMARIRNLYITTLLTQVSMQQHLRASPALVSSRWSMAMTRTSCSTVSAALCSNWALELPPFEESAAGVADGIG